MPDAAIIHRIKIERFRGIKILVWRPASGVNVILGGGDVGKTTILEAIALLLNPSNALVLSESDYWQRDTNSEFSIEAAITLPSSSEISQQSKFAWPWEWTGEEAVPPLADAEADDDIPSAAHPVYCLRVRGTSELEVTWEIVQPNGEVDVLSAAVRRKIGIVRLAGEDRNDRDLRLVYGSALDRLLADKGLRARIGQQVSEINLQDKLSEDARKALTKLDKALQAESLPSNLELGLTSSQGLSIGALIGLLAQSEEAVSLPLASWGAGTRRMTTLEIAAATEAESRITVIDEVERALEPYRVRKLVGALQDANTQTFVTTHSAVAISAADAARLWYLDSAGNIGELPRSKIAAQQARDPETFLAKFAVICEGPTEVGFVSDVLGRAIDGSFRDRGIHAANGQGNASALSLLEAMAGAGVTVAGFADHEGEYAGRWSTLKGRMGNRLFQWMSGCLEENVIRCVADDDLVELIKDKDGDLDGDRLRTLADRLGCVEKDIPTLKAAAQTQEMDFRCLIIAAATGRTDDAPAGRQKEWKAHSRKWFKSEAGGRELAAHMFQLGAWVELNDGLLPFLNAVRSEIGQSEIQDLAHE